ncbi:sugar ABC transporter substrate-binding protein [Spirochaetia bacterium]|nr:sugar ABC transporter substrate-binding protein [Spirochaetia bacterium]
MKIEKSDKIVIIVTVLLIAAALVVKIGFRSGGNARSHRPKTEKVNLVFTQLRESEWEQGALSSLIGEYKGLHPEVSIREQTQAYDEFRDAGAETAEPDIIVMESRYLAEFIKAGTFSFPDSQGAFINESRERVLPLASSMDVLFYNIDILRAAGFDRPPRDRTEFLRYAQAVSKGEGSAKQYGAALALSPADSRGVFRDVFSWIWAAGTAMTKEGVPDFNGKAINDTLAFLAQLEKEGLLAPQSFTTTGAERLNEFAAGKIAMMTGSVQDIAQLRDRMKDGAFGITLIPGPADYAGKPVFGLSTWYAGINAGSGHPDEAWNFLLYLQENSSRLAEQIRAVPGSNDSAAAYITEDPFYAKAWDMYEAADLVQELTTIPKIRELENAVREELANMFANNTTAADTAAAIQKKWE